TAHVPIRSHSSWIDGPPRRRIAPATPEPSCRASLAALTIASTESPVMSALVSSIEADMALSASGSDGAGNRIRDREISLRHPRLRLSRAEGWPGVPAQGDFGIEGILPRNGQADRPAVAPPASVLKDLLAAAEARPHEVGHVLDDPEHRHVDLLEHGQPL